VQASLTSHASLSQIARAASYALPALHAAGANSSDVMMLIATMMQGGIMNTKSGTWLNAMAMNALPNTLGSGLFKNGAQNNALHMLGLYKGNKSQFYKNGSMDLMQLVSILAKDRTHMEPLKFNALLKQSFGTQGQRAASFFSEDTTLSNLTALRNLKNQEQNPNLVRDLLLKINTISKADQTIANANITLMNATTTFMGPANAILDGASSFFSKTAPLADEHPLLASAGIAGAAFGGLVIGKLLWGGVAGGANGIAKLATGALGRALGSVVAGVPAAIAEMGGGFIALSSASALAISGVIGYGIGNVLKDIIDAVVQKSTGQKGATLGTWLYDSTHADPFKPQAGADGHDVAMKPTSGAATHVTHVHNYIDSKEVASVLIPHKSIGPSGFNQSAQPMPPGMNFGWGSN